MDTDPGVRCFRHCAAANVFCFALPRACPVCSADLATTQFRLEPFRVPYPFVRAAQHPCSIVIRPTTGDFLTDYQNSMDLHIGVTSSRGAVVEFDREGLHRGSRTSRWSQCLVVADAAGAGPACASRWDDVLAAIAAQPRWAAHAYHEARFNCYTFVLAFLADVGWDRSAAADRTAFCRKVIVPRTTAAGKYISLFRKLGKTGHYVMP